MKTKKDKQQEEITRRQIVCQGCDSRKLLVIALTYNQSVSLLELYCSSCGLLQNIHLGNSLVLQPEPIDKTRRDYLG